MESFKKYYNIEKEITLESKVENGRLFVFYNDQWVQLSREKNPDRFYKPLTLQYRYDANLCKELRLLIRKGKKYSRENYMKNREYYCNASKKYYAKKKKSQNSS